MPDLAEFDRDEFTDRWQRARTLMRASGLDALFISSEANYRYLGGHVTGFWVSKTRPLFLLLPLDGEPILLFTNNQLPTAQATSWVSDLRSWSGFAAEGVDLLAATLRERGLAGARIGAELGEEQRLGLPYLEFQRLQQALPRATFVDAAALLWSLRQIKSPSEVVYLRRAAQIASLAYRTTLATMRAGLSERDAFATFVATTFQQGAERPGYVPVHSGPGHYERITLGPTDRVLQAGDLLWMDGGCVYRGYWSDFTRLVAIGQASERQRDRYRRVRAIMHECVAAIRPGVTMRELTELAQRRFDQAGLAFSSHARIGHGLGLDITEPPSINLADPTVVAAGMVLTMEPTCAEVDGFFQLEENVVVTTTGCELLTEPAPAELPTLPGQPPDL